MTPESVTLLHDLRGLAATVALIAEAQADHADPRVRDQAARLGRCARRLGGLAGDGGDTAVRHGPATLREVLDDVARIAGTLASPSTSVEVSCDPDFARLEGSEALFRLLFNLVANGVRAVGETGGGTVALTGRRSGRAVLIAVSDDGPGFAARSGAEPCRPRAHRGGLGMTIADLLARQVGGSLRVVGSSPRGTTFSLAIEARWLPGGETSAADGAVPGRPHAAPEPAIAAAPRLRPAPARRPRPAPVPATPG